MKKSSLLVSFLALAALVVAGYSATNSKSAKVQATGDCCNGCECCQAGAACCSK